MAILLTASLDGRHEDQPYTLMLTERPRQLERYEVACYWGGNLAKEWSRCYCTLADALDDFWGEMRTYARDKDRADSNL